LVGFIRGGGAITLVPRLPVGLAGAWHGTTVNLPAGSWRDEFTGAGWEGGTRPLQDLLGRFPVALLSRLPGAA